MKTEETIERILTWLNGNIVSLSDFRDTIKTITGDSCSEDDIDYFIGEIIRRGLITNMGGKVSKRPDGAFKLPPNQNPNKGQ